MNTNVWALIIAVPSASDVMDLTHVYASTFDHEPSNRQIVAEFNRIATQENEVRDTAQARAAGWDWKVQAMPIIRRGRRS